MTRMEYYFYAHRVHAYTDYRNCKCNRNEYHLALLFRSFQPVADRFNSTTKLLLNCSPADTKGCLFPLGNRTNLQRYKNAIDDRNGISTARTASSADGARGINPYFCPANVSAYQDPLVVDMYLPAGNRHCAQTFPATPG